MLLIDAIAIVESGGRNTPGDSGAALSPFQIHRAAWDDVKKRFGDPAKPIYLNIGECFEDIGNVYHDLRMFARNCATGYSFLLEERLKHAGQEATPENIYACWNLGFAAFKKRHFDLMLCPKRTVQRARRVAVLATAPDPPPVHNGHD